MTDRQDLLIEIGTEELPPKALHRLSISFADNLQGGLVKAGFPDTGTRAFATPRRLAVLVPQLPASLPDKQILKRGPALAAARDADGRPTPAAEGFARSVGVTVAQLDTLETDKGSWLAYQVTQSGQTIAELLPGIIDQALAGLPIPRRMRWGDNPAEFVRPVHWLLLLHSDQTIDAEVLGIRSANSTRGHRFHHPQALKVTTPSEYADLLETQGHVIADFSIRRERIRAQVQACASAEGGEAVIDAALLDEVTGLVEWPVAFSGGFDPAFLAMPVEVLIATMKDHQKYFHLLDQDNRLLPRFIAVSNIDSRDMGVVRHGNERVIHPRLSDANFFWNKDRETRLDARIESLGHVVFQQALGSLYQKAIRVADLSALIDRHIGSDQELARRAGMLAKCDLMTDMVGEFPELQGVMGRYYALHDGEDAELAMALDEQYLPRFAGDALPTTGLGRCLAIADKLDTLVGIFAIGQAPTGDKDPFALRRAALGLLRIIIEHGLDLDLEELIQAAIDGYDGQFEDREGIAGRVFDFLLERLRAYYTEAGYGTDLFEAVLARRPTRPADFDRRLQAVSRFRQLPESESLAAANKRIHNILRKAPQLPAGELDPALLLEAEEKKLATELQRTTELIQPLLQADDFNATLSQLASLKEPVDAFFDAVMVMAEDAALRDNRLRLLQSLREQFLRVADISRLQA